MDEMLHVLAPSPEKKGFAKRQFAGLRLEHGFILEGAAEFTVPVADANGARARLVERMGALGAEISGGRKQGARPLNLPPKTPSVRLVLTKGGVTGGRSPPP